MIYPRVEILLYCLTVFNSDNLLEVKTFRRTFVKHLAHLGPARNKIHFKLRDNDDYGAFEGELKRVKDDSVPHGLGRLVRMDGACLTRVG
jgi:hypothetical protein